MAGEPEIRIRGYVFTDVTNSTHADALTYEQALAKTYAMDVLKGVSASTDNQ